MQHKHLELLCQCTSVPEAHGPFVILPQSRITLRASPKQCEFLLPNVALPPFQKQVNSTNKRRLALHLRNEADQTEIDTCKPDSSPVLC